MNNLICSFGAKMAQSGIVTLIGVGMVFIILGMLIGIISILRYLDKILDNWDDYMIYFRARKGEIKVIKHAYKNTFEHESGLVSERLDKKEISKDEAKAQLAALKVDKANAVSEYKQSKIAINAKYDSVFNIRKEYNFKIKELRKAESAEYKAAKAALSGENKKADAESLKNARMVKRVALNDQINAVRNECKAKIALAQRGEAIAANIDVAGASQDSEVTDSRLVAVITAAVTMMMSDEGQAKKAGFRVRSIREIK